MLILEIRKQMRIRNYYFILEDITPQGEKQARIRATLQGRYSGHSIIHHSIFSQTLEAELLKFPGGKHDDIADAMAGAVSMTTAKNIMRTSPGNITPNSSSII
jgi:phage terminase large subunit-like protein